MSVMHRLICSFCFVLLSGVGSHAQVVDAEQEISAFFASYDRTISAKNLDLLASMYHPLVTVTEALRMDATWVKYRDEHLEPELRSMNELQFRHVDLSIHLLAPTAAYVTGSYEVRYVGESRMFEAGLVTHVLMKGEKGWLIRHSHTIPRRRVRG